MNEMGHPLGALRSLSSTRTRYAPSGGSPIVILIEDMRLPSLVDDETKAFLGETWKTAIGPAAGTRMTRSMRAI